MHKYYISGDFGSALMTHTFKCPPYLQFWATYACICNMMNVTELVMVADAMVAKVVVSCLISSYFLHY